MPDEEYVTVKEPEEESTANAPADAWEMGLAGALAKQYAEDIPAFLTGLARLLEMALPDETQVKRAGLFGGEERPVRRIEVAVQGAMGGDSTRYTIENSGRGPLGAMRTRVVRGIALKTEPILVEEWITAVGSAVAARARGNKAILDALKTYLA